MGTKIKKSELKKIINEEASKANEVKKLYQKRQEAVKQLKEHYSQLGEEYHDEEEMYEDQGFEGGPEGAGKGAEQAYKEAKKGLQWLGDQLKYFENTGMYDGIKKNLEKLKDQIEKAGEGAGHALRDGPQQDDQLEEDMIKLKEQVENLNKKVKKRLKA